MQLGPSSSSPGHAAAQSSAAAQAGLVRAAARYVCLPACASPSECHPPAARPLPAHLTVCATRASGYVKSAAGAPKMLQLAAAACMQLQQLRGDGHWAERCNACLLPHALHACPMRAPPAPRIACMQEDDPAQMKYMVLALFTGAHTQGRNFLTPAVANGESPPCRPCLPPPPAACREAPPCTSPPWAGKLPWLSESRACRTVPCSLMASRRLGECAAQAGNAGSGSVKLGGVSAPHPPCTRMWCLQLWLRGIGLAKARHDAGDMCASAAAPCRLLCCAVLYMAAYAHIPPAPRAHPGAPQGRREWQSGRRRGMATRALPTCKSV